MSANSHRTHPAAKVGFLVLLLILPFMAACTSSISMRVEGSYQPIPSAGIDFGQFNSPPRPRLGGLGYPGPFTLFETADPDHLGRHSYSGQFLGTEIGRGIVYTRRGGFIDIAHARKTIDLCKYSAVHIEMALQNDWSALRIKSIEPSDFVIRLDYPPFWKSLSPAEKQQLAHELSIRMGQRMAMLMITWHEVLTWFGYQSTPLIPERQSAFAWDDTGAHAFGVLVGGRALRDANQDWDHAVTDAIDRTLRELGAVGRDQTVFATRCVEGLWWRGFDPLKRQVELGWDGQPLQAWLVRDLPFAAGAAPYRYELPRLDNVMGHDLGHIMRVEIQPNVFQTGDIRRVIPGEPPAIDADSHLPILLDYIRQWHIQREGEQTLRPY